MSTPSFNVIDEHWIHVVDDKGNRKELGLRDVLLQAHELREIRDPMPTVEFGLYRLLTALILDIHEFDDADLDKLSNLLDTGRFSDDEVNSYLDRHRDRFDLFSDDYPFLQTLGMKDDPIGAMAALAHAIPSGSNQIHFHHRAEADFRVGPAAAARLLTTLAPFTTAGGRGYSPSINGTPPWYVLVCGDSLFQTLCFNTCVVPVLGTIRDTPPAWRNDRPPTPGARRSNTSLREAMTWRPRRLQLIAGEAGRCSIDGTNCPVTISTLRFTAGDSCDFTAWRDPSVPYMTVDKGVYAIRPKEGKELWRETGPLALLKDQGNDKVQFTRPNLIDQFHELRRSRAISKDTRLNLVAYGIRTDQMKVFEWRRESLSVPFALVMDRSSHQVCQDEIDKADEVSSKLRTAVKMTFPRKGEGAKAPQETVAVCAQQWFWHSLQVAHTRFLDDLAVAEADVELRAGAIAEWRSEVKRHAWTSLSNAIDHLDTDNEALRRWAEARHWFGKQLAVAYMTNEEKLTAKQRKAKKEKG